MMAVMLGINARDFAEGWLEGRGRYKAQHAPQVVGGSQHKPGTVQFAASQAAVAFYIGMEK
jgi:hypothetical protein